MIDTEQQSQCGAKIALSSISIKVRYAETDKMGVVHHSVYPIYFEAGRSDFFNNHIIPYSQMEKEGIWAPVVSFSCTIKSTAHYDETLTVITKPVVFSPARITMEYEVRKGSELIATGTSTHTFITPERKIVRTRDFPELHLRLSKVFPAQQRGNTGRKKENNL